MGRESVGQHFPVIAPVKPIMRRKQTTALSKADKLNGKLRAVVN
jgi:hypothetical protein